MTQNGMYHNWLFRSAMRQTPMRLRRPFCLVFFEPDGVEVSPDFGLCSGGNPVVVPW